MRKDFICKEKTSKEKKNKNVMKYLPDDLKKEYEYLIKNNSDIEELKSPYINLSDTLRAYFILAHFFTDPSSEATESMLIGVRDINLLASALGRQIVSFSGKRKYVEGIDICSTLFFGMVKNHSFSDGNKRTALLVLLYQLGLFGYVPSAPQKDFEKLVVAVAADRMKEVYASEYKKNRKKDDPIVSTISYLIRKMVKRKDHTYHINPTMKEFCEAVECQGGTYKLIGNKIHFERKVKKLWYRKNEIYSFSVNFSGWTRTVGADTARKIMKKLDLYDSYANYADFLEGHETMYELVDQFSGPLRRLKDK